MLPRHNTPRRKCPSKDKMTPDKVLTPRRKCPQDTLPLGGGGGRDIFASGIYFARGYILSIHPFTHPSSPLSTLEWSCRVNEAVGFAHFSSSVIKRLLYFLISVLSSLTKVPLLNIFSLFFFLYFLFHTLVSYDWFNKNNLGLNRRIFGCAGYRTISFLNWSVSDTCVHADYISNK